MELFILLISSFLTFLVGMFVLLKNHKSVTNMLFAVLCFALIGWTVANYFSIHILDPASIFLLVKLVFFFVIIQNTSYFLLMHNFPAVKLRGNRILLVGYLSFSALVVVLLTAGQVLKSYTPVDNTITLIPGQLIVIFILQVLVSILGGFYFLVRNYLRSNGQTNAQYSILLLASVLLLVLVPVTNFVLPLYFQINLFVSVSPLYTLLFASAIAYAIVAQKLFDVRLVVARSVVYILSIGVLAGLYGILAFRVATLFIDSWPIEWQRSLYIFLAVVLALTFAPLKRFFERVTNSIFYRDHYDTENLINRIGRILAGEIELDVVAKEVVHEITRQMKISRGEIVVFGKSQIFYENDVFKANRAPISKQELRKLGPRLAIADDLQGGIRKEVMDRYGINVSVALRTKKQFLGYLLLSDKRSGDIYTQQDVRVLRTLGSEVSVAVQNALSYKEIQLFNETLSERVAQRTAQLRTANQQLHALDAAKDEFISMASHQLRTPLTTVKGYASMLEEGDFGKLTKEQRDKVELTLDGANRMARLIDDLLNVSRMDANRFFLEVNEVDMMSLVDSELVQLQTMAESKKVKLSYTPPAEKLPLIRLDENKTRQVVMNLVDNAIHYGQPASGEAQVNVKMERDGSHLVFEVSDNGIGVPAAAQKHLFTKMFRADNAKDVRPDGTGLGLYLVKRVIEDQGGEIIFKSQEGKGSTFGFRLPLSGVPKSVEAKSRKISAKVATHPKG